MPHDPAKSHTVSDLEKCSVNNDDADSPPEGGYGWLVVLGNLIASFVTFGYNAAWGVFQEHYYAVVFGQEVELTVFSMMGSAFLVVTLLVGPFLRKPLALLGVRGVLFGGTVIMVASFLLASLAVQPWQLIVTQGVLLGLGSGMIYYPAIGLISQYFSRRLSLAMGIATSGSGLGGFVLAPVVRRLLDVVGHAWTLRILAAGYAVLLSFVIAVCKERAPMHDTATTANLQEKQPRLTGVAAFVNKFFDVRILSKTPVQALTLVSIIGSFAYAAPFYFVPSYVLHIGYTHTDAAFVVGVMSAVNAAGRIILGQVAQVLGTANMFFATTFLAGTLCIAVWPFATTLWSVLVFVSVFGCFSGGYISLITTVTAESADKNTMADTMGLVFSVEVVGNLCGATIFAALLNLTGGMSYLPSQAFCAASYLVASIFILWLRLDRSKTLWKAV